MFEKWAEVLSCQVTLDISGFLAISRVTLTGKEVGHLMEFCFMK